MSFRSSEAHVPRALTAARSFPTLPSFKAGDHHTPPLENPIALESKERLKAVELAVSQIERQFGKGSIMKLGSERAIPVPAISTGSLGLDWALGIGGRPRGRIVEIYGPEASGKTTLALTVIGKFIFARRYRLPYLLNYQPQIRAGPTAYVITLDGEVWMIEIISGPPFGKQH